MIYSSFFLLDFDSFVKICGEGRFYYCFDIDLVPLLLSMGQKIQYLISMERGVRV